MIQLEVEKVYVNERRMFKIVDFKMLPFSQLPKEYSCSDCHCFCSRDKKTRFCVSTLSFSRSFSKGSILSIQSFRKLIDSLKACGNNLMKINKKIKEEKRKRWSGNVVVSI